MTTKHTEGKWINSGGYVQALYQDSPKTFFHTIANCNQNLVSPAKTEANARLIAAAPELLEACEKLHDFILHLPVLEFGILELQELSELAHKALSKAKGES